uniref:Uncharacterized protein n=1 Tax=Caenorhabditis japonica TaxID=281687 RepID=A0A8R1IL33_CAEJA
MRIASNFPVFNSGNLISSPLLHMELGSSEGVANGVACIVAPILAPTTVAMQEAGRRASLKKEVTPIADISKQDSLGERASSKLTLDDELYDILYAFG